MSASVAAPPSGGERNSTRPATTSSALRRLPSSASQERLRRRPSIPTRLPLPRYSVAELGLAVPDADVDEVRAGVLRRPVDREQEAGHLLSIADSLQLDVRGEVPDEADDVHASTVAGDAVTCLCQSSAEVAANLWALGVWRSLVARSVRVGEVPSSNLGTPIASVEEGARGEPWFPRAKAGSALRSGRRGPQLKSGHPIYRAVRPPCARCARAAGRPRGSRRARSRR